ncbi:MAG: ORF6N domain-containing protein [Verrucomicrobiota bacterium]
MPLSIVPSEHIDRAILNIRGQKVILDADLAYLYGVSTKVFNQAVKRNIKRFPDDFIFQLTKDEKNQVVTNCDHLARLKFSKTLPYAFTEHGVLMAANVLNSSRAIDASIAVVRAFIHLRRLTANIEVLSRKINAMEKMYDNRFKVIFSAIKRLMAHSTIKDHRKQKIGFRGSTN